MRISRQQRETLAVANYDLFANVFAVDVAPEKALPKELPTEEELGHLFDRFNNIFFSGRLPRPHIEYSSRMLNAGAYYPHRSLIRIGRRYHELFPEDLEDTLKHEMIHLIHLKHDTAFRREAKRIGTTLKGRAHPDLVRPARFIYTCDSCGTDYPRHKRLIMASCGVCSTSGKYDARFKLRLKSSRKR